MRSRREQVQAYRFVTRRIVSAQLSGEPETTELPMRRLGLAVFGSAMLATIVFAAIGVYGLRSPSGGTLDEDALVIERESGARFVYIEHRLHPVLNYSSARLILDSATPVTKTLSRRSLRDVPRGRPVGIPDAPDSLPESSLLMGLPWSACGMRRSAGSVSLVVQLVIGGAPGGGQALGTDALLVSEGTGEGAQRFLLWNGQRLKVADTSVLAALGYTAATAVGVGQALLNSIPSGPDLAAVPVDRAGESGPSVNGQPAALGQMFQAGGQYYVLTSSGLAPVGEVMARLRLASGGQVTDIPAGAAAQALSSVQLEPEGFPQSVPRLRNTGAEPAMICSEYGTTGAAASTVEIQVFGAADPQLADGLGALPAAGLGPDGVRLADRVLVPGGRGALVRILPAVSAPTPLTTTYLITDQGVKYALGGTDAAGVQEALGYASATAIALPGYLLGLLPTGPALDPEQARQFLPAVPAATGSAAASASATPSATASSGTG